MKTTITALVVVMCATIARATAGLETGALAPVAPFDSGAAYGAQVPFRVTARDSSNNPVASFYVGWSSSNSAHTINANGVFTAGSGRATVWVHAQTPTGIKDSTRITVAPAPSAVQIVSGNNQSAEVGTALPDPLVVRVTDSLGAPAASVVVKFVTCVGSSLGLGVGSLRRPPVPVAARSAAGEYGTGVTNRPLMVSPRL